MEYTRRQMLTLSGLGLVGLLGCETGPVAETKAYRIAKDFPGHKNARAITRHPVSGSSKCIIHVRQKHSVRHDFFTRYVQPQFADPIKKKRWRQAYADINDCQKDISELLLSAADNYRGDVTFFAEGGHGAISVRQAEEAYSAALTRLDESKLIEFPILERITEYQSLIKKKLAAEELPRLRALELQMDSIRYIPGADLLLALNRKITLYGAETEEGLAQARNRLLACENPLHPSDALLDEIMAARDVLLLKIIEGSPSVVNVVTLGANHALAGAVDSWNSRNANKYSIVSVTPNACEK